MTKEEAEDWFKDDEITILDIIKNWDWFCKFTHNDPLVIDLYGKKTSVCMEGRYELVIKRITDEN